MKKMLLTVIMLIMTTVHAKSMDVSIENRPYIRAQGGWVKLDHIRSIFGLMGYPDRRDVSGKARSYQNGHLGVGMGCYINDKMRVELNFNHYANPVYKFNAIYTDPLNIEPPGEIICGKIKSEVNSIVLNGFVDIYNVDDVTLSFGVGLGSSRLKAWVSSAGKAVRRKITPAKFKIVHEHEFTFATHLVAAYKLNSDTTGELSYSYRNLGTLDRDDERNPYEIRGHHITTGIKRHF